MTGISVCNSYLEMPLFINARNAMHVAMVIAIVQRGMNAGVNGIYNRMATMMTGLDYAWDYMANFHWFCPAVPAVFHGFGQAFAYMNHVHTLYALVHIVPPLMAAVTAILLLLTKLVDLVGDLVIWTKNIMCFAILSLYTCMLAVYNRL